MDVRYTSDDWLLGRIRKDVKLGVIDISDFKTSKYSLSLLREMFERDLIKESEFQLIENLTYQTFRKGASLSIDVLFKKFKLTYENAPYPEELLEIEISEIKNRIEKFHQDIQKEVLEGRWSPKDITEIEVGNYTKAKERREVLHISNPSPLPSESKNINSALSIIQATFKDINNAISRNDYTSQNIKKEVESYLETFRSNQLYDATILKGYLRKLKNHQNTVSSLGDGNSNDYGIHQINREWIIREFAKEIEIQPSQNRAVIKVKEAYQKEFNLKIGKTTILRIVGRA